LNAVRRKFLLARQEFRVRFKTFLGKLPVRLAHLFFFAGIVSIIAGASLVYRPAGFIVGGLFAMWVSFLIAAEANTK